MLDEVKSASGGKKTLKSEFIKTMTQLATAAFGFVAALAWNEAVKGLIDRFVEPGSGLRSKIYYAVIVTVIAVLVTYFLGRATQEESEKESAKHGSADNGEKK